MIAAFLLGVMWRKSLLARFASVTAYLSVVTLQTSISIATLFFREELGISKLLDYNIFFYTRWTSFFLLSALVIMIIYGVFQHAMKPFEGLHRAGKLIFRWIFAVSLVVSLGIAIAPHIAKGFYFLNLSGQLQQATSILTLCLLLFVCFAIRHLGMTYRSHVFGISLGLGIVSTVSLVQSAWFSSMQAESLYSQTYFYSALGSCLALAVWGTYFAMPEPARRMILLPTTSPYFLWNSISEALGDSPGQVAIVGFTPEMLAPAELKVLTAASKAGRERRAAEDAIAAQMESEPMPQAFAMQQ